jgi:predicted RecA/RadA family phage recombinase
METALLLKTNQTPVTLPGGNDHPVVDLPFTAIIDGRQFRGRGLSLVAAYVSGLMDPQAVKSTRIVRLVFQFDGFSVTLVVDADVRENSDSSGVSELSFIHPTGAHLPQLRHILNAFIAGDLVGLGQTLGVAGTAAPKGPKAQKAPESRMSAKRVMGGIGVGLLTIALAGLAGTLAYNRVFQTLVPSLGTVVSTGEVMRATATGQIVFLDLAAAQGDVAVAIQATSGDVQSLLMPCDCAASATGLREGSTVLLGEPLVQLAAETDQTVVSAMIPQEMLFDLMQADRVELTFPDGATLSAQPVIGTSAAGTDPITLQPLSPLDASRIGQPVEIRILHDAGILGVLHGSVFDRLANFVKGA